MPTLSAVEENLIGLSWILVFEINLMLSTVSLWRGEEKAGIGTVVNGEGEEVIGEIDIIR